MAKEKILETGKKHDKYADVFEEYKHASQEIADKMPIVPKSKRMEVVKFKTLDEFVNNYNNFILYFLEKGDFSVQGKKLQASYLRFKKAYPKLLEELTNEITSIFKNNRDAPKERLKDIYPKMYKAYRLMSKMVCKDDPFVESKSTLIA